MRVSCALALVVPVLLAQSPSEPGRWAFEPKPDEFSAHALLDLRFLNEETAGESGFLRTSAEGDILLGDGTPMRIWAVNTTVGREKPFVARPQGRKTEPDLARHARFLAKRGVNMVRLHAHINPPRSATSLQSVNTAERDWIWRTVAAMKKEGIYTVVSPYWANTMEFNKDWGYPLADGATAHSLLFFDEALQQAYRAWMRALLAETNPYTGIPLAKDPALGIIQIQNEDSLLFWNVNNLKGEHLTAMRRKFGEWCVKKYGSLDAAFSAWSNRAVTGDDRAAGLLGLYNLWDMTEAGRTAQRPAGESRRIADQLEFWTRTMYEFNRSTAEFLREELGCGQIVNAGNWKTGDAVRLEDAERFSYTATEVQAVNRYYTGIHNGPNRTWAIVRNDEFTSPSVLLNPRDFPLNLKQTRGIPMMVTESAWVYPTATSVEAPFLVAAYQSLTGIDAYFWFSTGDDEWTPPQSANGFLASQQKWMFGSPDMLGTFPAAALMHRMGYIRRGDPVVVEERALEDLWMRRTAVIAESASYDPNRDSGDIAPQSSLKTGVDPLAFLAGPVEVVFGGDPAASRVADLTPLIDAARKQVTSITGEIQLDFEKGFCLINTAKAQGVAAHFANQREFATDDLAVVANNGFGTVLAVSMDNEDLRQSRRILVQVGMPSRPAGWKDEPKEITAGGQTVAGSRVVEFGRAPWQIERPQVELTVRNPYITKVVALDANGNEAGVIAHEPGDASLRFRFPENAIHVMLIAE